jgi:hypothetical protein
VRIALALAVALVLAVTGCGGGEEAASAVTLGERLDALCTETRLAVEALGEPRDVGGAVLRPWAALGARFVSGVGLLETPTAGERAELRSLATRYRGFFDGLRLGYEQWAAGESFATKMTLQRAYASLAGAEAVAARLGATACSLRPFDDT